MTKDIIATDLYSAELPAHLQGKEQMQRGSEDVGMDDLTIPRISIIQDLSPQHKKSKPEYIEGAAVGMAFNSATQTLLGSSFFIIPVVFRKEYVIWKDRDSGGGFEGAFPDMAAAKAELATLENPELMDIIDTGQHFILVIDEETGTAQEAVISMSKSQMKISRQLNTMARMAGGDRFSRVYRMDVVEAQNKKNQDFNNWKVTQMGYAPEALYLQAETMYEAVKAGERDVSRNEEDTSDGASDSGLTEEDLDNM